MILNLPYHFIKIFCIPLLPILYFQGKKIKKSVPVLPEARNPEGLIEIQKTKALNIILLGESTFAGVGVETHDVGFAGTLAKNLATTLNQSVYYKVYAKSGYTLQKLNEKIIPKITEKEVDILIIGMGGNDAFKLNSPSSWNYQTKILITTLQEKFPNIPIFFTNVPPIKSFPAFTLLIKFIIGNLGQLLGKNLKETIKFYPNTYFNDEYITLESWIKKYNLKNQPSAFFSDGVHPSALTYQTWALDTANFITKNIYK